MKVLVVTTKQLEDRVLQELCKSKVDASILAADVGLASLLSPSIILRELRKVDLRSIDLVIVPGHVRGDLSDVGRELGVRIVKGPLHLADLPLVLELLDTLELSATEPARLPQEALEARAREIVQHVEERAGELLQRPWNLRIGDVAIGRDFPARVVAEIVDAPLLSDHKISKMAKYYARSGASIIDIGMVAGETKVEDAARCVKAVRAAVELPVSIDTMDPAEAEAAVSAGADLILSIDASNAKQVAEFGSDVAVVVIPTNFKQGLFPTEAEEKVRVLERNIALAKRLGFKNIVADLLATAPAFPGLLEALVAYRMFARRNPNIPLLFGVGNVTELLDADSVGINALLACLASEVGISLLLTTEASEKTKGSVHELATAALMAFIARRRRSFPKDMGIDLLLLKKKTTRP